MSYEKDTEKLMLGHLHKNKTGTKTKLVNKLSAQFSCVLSNGTRYSNDSVARCDSGHQNEERWRKLFPETAVSDSWAGGRSRRPG